MTAPPDPIDFVDPHMHLWDHARGWYQLDEEPEWDPSRRGGLGDWTGIGDWRPLRRLVDLDAYRAAMVGAGLRAAGCVHVTAAKTHWRDETAWLDAVAAADGTGLLGGIVAYVDPTAPVAEALGLLDAHLAASALVRGIRFLHRFDFDSPVVAALLARLAREDLVFDLVHGPTELAQAAAFVARFPDVRFVLEHTGYPGSADPDEAARWRDGIHALAAHPNVSVKLCGLPMVFHFWTPDDLLPWLRHSLEAFGVHRSMVASNFPVDGLNNTWADLFAVYRTLADPLSPSEAHALFAGNARRVYRLSGGRDDGRPDRLTP